MMMRLREERGGEAWMKDEMKAPSIIAYHSNLSNAHRGYAFHYNLGPEECLLILHYRF
jgi:hypothetical protein